MHTESLARTWRNEVIMIVFFIHVMGNVSSQVKSQSVSRNIKFTAILVTFTLVTTAQSQVLKGIFCISLQDSSIPKIRSKIARPSSIPSLKPGLLRGQTRLKSAAPQESKLKPIKALKPTHTLLNEPKAGGAYGKGKIPSNSLNKFVTPKKNSEAKHVRSNTQDNQTRRRSTDLSTSMSRLNFSRPNHNSTPKQQDCPVKQSSSLRRSSGSAANPMKTSSSSINTPLKTKSLGHVKREIGQDTPSKKSTSFRRSLVPKPSLNQNDTSLRASVYPLSRYSVE